MRKGLAISSLLSLLIFVVGCQQQAAEMKTLTIEKQTGVKGHYKKINEIKVKDKIETVIDLFLSANWENAEVSMHRPPNFKINNLYDIWITPQKNRLEVVIRGKSKYTKLSEKDSQTLYKIMTDTKLGE
ncbi:hypothetical protein [Neobacillus massiliamazoniensis]|uniref:Lipoprotein n=1 Tax=Neobacillus massiliamazoniensis TaxID=1499688 RepID=A0A0U1NW65_9BACI|nr:hypothetical protein [Neobacillus massiliamazoniensis]CRK82264.1 lipoprotein [Neobacillus massiliamazoniensis]